MNALQLFRTGLDTVAIAGILKITEAQASYRVHRLRSKELGRPFCQLLPKPVWPCNRIKAAGCK